MALIKYAPNFRHQAGRSPECSEWSAERFWSHAYIPLRNLCCDSCLYRLNSPGFLGQSEQRTMLFSNLCIPRKQCNVGVAMSKGIDCDKWILWEYRRIYLAWAGEKWCCSICIVVQTGWFFSSTTLLGAFGKASNMTASFGAYFQSAVDKFCFKFIHEQFKIYYCYLRF